MTAQLLLGFQAIEVVVCVCVCACAIQGQAFPGCQSTSLSSAYLCACVLSCYPLLSSASV